MVDMVNMVQSTMFGTNSTTGTGMEPASDVGVGVSPAVLRLHYAGRGARAHVVRRRLGGPHYGIVQNWLARLLCIHNSQAVISTAARQ